MTVDSPQQVYELEIPVQPADIDQIGHVNNVVYLRWVQEVAIAHWGTLASEDQKQKLLWVVTKHEIEYKRPAIANDTIIARTWVGEARNRNFARHTDLLRKADRKLLARAVTLWTPIDSDTRKPVDVDASVYELFSSAPETQNNLPEQQQKRRK